MGNTNVRLILTMKKKCLLRLIVSIGFVFKMVIFFSELVNKLNKNSLVIL